MPFIYIYICIYNVGIHIHERVRVGAWPDRLDMSRSITFTYPGVRAGRRASSESLPSQNLPSTPSDVFFFVRSLWNHGAPQSPRPGGNFNIKRFIRELIN